MAFAGPKQLNSIRLTDRIDRREAGLNPRNGSRQGGDRTLAQQAADRILMLREELAGAELSTVLALSSEQRTRFDEWSQGKLTALAQQFDVDTTVSQKQMSWGMRIASALGGLAICAAVVLFFNRFWGYLETWAQVAIVVLTPLLLLAATECMSRRERTRYFTGLLALVAVVSFIMNLVVLGNIFNITSSQGALLAWGLFAIVVAYRYGLRLILAWGLLLLMGYCAAQSSAQMGYQWLGFYERPELLLPLSLVVFAVPLGAKHFEHGDFAAVYRLVGALTFLIGIGLLSEAGELSYLPFDSAIVEPVYGIAALFLSAAAIWLGIACNWKDTVNTGACFFVVFLVTRMYHWWWAWMPKYLFFALIGTIGIVIVLIFRRVRSGAGGGNEVQV